MHLREIETPAGPHIRDLIWPGIRMAAARMHIADEDRLMDDVLRRYRMDGRGTVEALSGALEMALAVAERAA